jgi:hypothetical protein
MSGELENGMEYSIPGGKDGEKGTVYGLNL